MSSDSAEPTDNICVVCFKNVEIYSIGNCDHMVCYECSTRMRVLCRQNECPICRQELPRVIFTCTIKPFIDIQNSTSYEDKKFKICFQNKKIQDAFYKLLEHNCSVCPSNPTFRTFQHLYDHMKKQHSLHYCDLCVEHLKIFTYERQCYNSKDLDLHKKKGDANDRSHRGHPLCQFCDVRYMDNDCLYRHLRRDHLYCHFCDADGLDLYYSSYDYLREHFQTEHYLCEEGACIDEKFTPVFRTEIDLKAHRASVHGRTLSKAAAKQARTLELEFTLRPRPRQGENSKRGRPGQSETSLNEGAVGGLLEQKSESARANMPNLDSSEFPSLPSGSNSAPIVLPQQRGRQNGMAIQFMKRNAPLDMTEENFPVLGVNSDSPIPGTSGKSNNNQEKGGKSKGGNSGPKVLSIHVNHKSTSENKSNKITQHDFPSLSSSNKKMQQNQTTVNWAKISNKKPEPSTSKPSSSTSATTKSAKPPKLNGADDFPSLHSKFNANLNLRANEPTKTNFVNVKTYKNMKADSGKEKKTTDTVPVTETQQTDSSDVLTASLLATTSKAKSKKKRTKGNITEEKSDTAKKKSNQEDGKLDSTKSAKDSQNSALTAGRSGETVLEKPLPKVEDWFGDLKKSSMRSQEEQDDPDLFSFTSAHPFSASSQFNSLLTNQIPDIFTEISSNIYNGNSSDSNSSNGKNSFKNSDGTKQPPPGFDCANSRFNNNNELNRPPPGFSDNYSITVNGLTEAGGESFPISPEFDYTPPSDFEKRNQKLVAKVNKLISNSVSLDQFRKKSLLFRQNQMTAKEYYDHCTKTMNAKGLQEVFPELLVLLPDIRKQQELFQVYSESPSYSKAGAGLDICLTCNQVIGVSDVKQHYLNHSLQRSFPSLKTDWTK